MVKFNSIQIIESETNPQVEHAYAKFPLIDIQPITLRSDKYAVRTSLRKVRLLKKAYERERYTHIHTHPRKEGLRRLLDFIPMFPDRAINPIPSYTDIANLLSCSDRKTEIIVHRGESTGKVYEYLFLRKTKETEELKKESEDALEHFHEHLDDNYSWNSLSASKKIKVMKKVLGIQVRLVKVKKARRR